MEERKKMISVIRNLHVEVFKEVIKDRKLYSLTVFWNYSEAESTLRSHHHRKKIK